MDFPKKLKEHGGFAPANMSAHIVTKLGVLVMVYLIAGSHDAAARAGMLYSFMAMCQMENVNPQQWLSDVLQRINDHRIQNLGELLPAT